MMAVNKLDQGFKPPMADIPYIFLRLQLAFKSWHHHGSITRDSNTSFGFSLDVEELSSRH